MTAYVLVKLLSQLCSGRLYELCFSISTWAKSLDKLKFIRIYFYYIQPHPLRPTHSPLWAINIIKKFSKTPNFKNSHFCSPMFLECGVHLKPIQSFRTYYPLELVWIINLTLIKLLLIVGLNSQKSDASKTIKLWDHGSRG